MTNNYKNRMRENKEARGLRTKSARKTFDRKGLYSINDVLFNISVDIRNFNGDRIDMTSDRYKTFAVSTVCVTCGLEAKYFAKERHFSHGPHAKYHFNLYGVREDGSEVMFTKDHIIPKSKGGPCHMSNYQTMCARCNEKKGNKMESVEVTSA